MKTAKELSAAGRLCAELREKIKPEDGNRYADTLNHAAYHLLQASRHLNRTAEAIAAAEGITK